MNYKIINDMEELENFIDWLPQLEVNEKFYVTLFARKKYSSTVKKDKGALKRFLATKSNLVNKLRQLEVAEGVYEVDGTSMPQEALAVYITPSPRNLKKAVFPLSKHLTDLLERDNKYNLHADTLSHIQAARSYNYVISFDLDTDDGVDTFIPTIDKCVGKGNYVILVTRGGYHILVYPRQAKSHNRRWFLDLVDSLGDSLDIEDSDLMPIPGTTQGGHTPYFY